MEFSLGNSLLWYHDVLPTFLATLGSDFCSTGVLRSSPRRVSWPRSGFVYKSLSSSSRNISSLHQQASDFRLYSLSSRSVHINLLAGSRCIRILFLQLPFSLSPTSWQATAQSSQQQVTKAALVLLSAVSPPTQLTLGNPLLLTSATSRPCHPPRRHPPQPLSAGHHALQR